MTLLNRVKAIPLSSVSAGDITFPAFTAINNGLEHACALIRITNTTSGDVTISFNGEEDHDVVVSGSFFEIFAQNTAMANYRGNFKKGLVVYVRGPSTGEDGAVFLSGYYHRA